MRPVWLNRDLTLLFAGRGVRSLTQGYLAIIVPLYLATLGYSAVQLGLIFTASSIASAILAAAVGIYSDRFGRKLFLVILALLAAFGGLVFALSGSFLVLLVAGAISTIGRGGGAGSGGAWGPYYPAEQALLAEHADDEHRTAVFGATSFVGVLAGAVGSLLAILPSVLQSELGMGKIDSDRVLFGMTVIFGIAMAVVVLPVRETRQSAVESRPRPKRAGRVSPATVRTILKFMATNATNGLAIGFLGPILVYWLYRRYGVGAAELGGLFTLINLATAPSYLYAARIARRLGAVNAVVLTRVVSVGILAFVPLMPVYPLAAALLLARMVTNTLSNPIRQSYLMAIIPREERATAAGFSNLPTQVFSSIGPTIAGYMMESISLDLPLEFAALFQGVNAVLYYFFFHGIKPPEEQGKGEPLAKRAVVPSAIEPPGR
ncbi:MAG: MFS transporter [Chloroflexota bacterium]